MGPSEMVVTSQARLEQVTIPSKETEAKPKQVDLGFKSHAAKQIVTPLT